MGPRLTPYDLPLTIRQLSGGDLDEARINGPSQGNVVRVWPRVEVVGWARSNGLVEGVPASGDGVFALEPPPLTYPGDPPNGLGAAGPAALANPHPVFRGVTNHDLVVPRGIDIDRK